MPRAHLRRVSEFPYHVTSRVNNKDWFSVPLEMVWEIFCEKLAIVTEDYGARVSDFVLMSNHFHMLLTTPNKNLDSIMQYLLREFSRTLGPISGRINHIFGGRYKSSLIYEPIYYAHAFKYVYRNPVVAQMVDRVEDYPFSTFRYWRGARPTPFPLHAPPEAITRFVPVDRDASLLWLNSAYNHNQAELISRSLKRSTFAFTKRKNDQPVVKELLSEFGYQK